MKARIVTNDSATGCETVFDTDLPSLTGEAVRDAVVEQLKEDAGDDETEQHNVAAWVKHGNTYAFILTTEDGFFGDLVVVGYVYPEVAS